MERYLNLQRFATPTNLARILEYRKQQVVGVIVPRPLLNKILNTLRTRHAQLVRWLAQSEEPEILLRLGGELPLKAAELEVKQLASAINKAERAELGQCEVCHEDVEDLLFAMDYTACVCLDHLDAEQRSRLENELELSQKVQRALLPQASPSIRGWEVAAFSQPASIVGGDYFDFLKFGDYAHAFIIADVMGKGMPASMLMANMQASLRIIVPESKSPDEVVVRLNRLFHHNISLTKFVSLFIGHLDPATGRLLYANAGHHPPFVVRRSGAGKIHFDTLRPTGPAIGLVEDSIFTVGEATIHQGDLLVMYTDGIVEARSLSGEEFGEERFKNILGRFSKRPVQGITQEVRSQLHSFAGKPVPDDDVTLIVSRRNGG